LNKGQLISGDFFLSMGIFLTVLGISLVIFNYVSLRIIDNQEEDFMHTVATATADVLINTEGSPRNWNETNVRSVGLESNGFLNRSKVIRMVGMDYDSLRNALRIKPYEMRITFNGINGSVLNLSGTELQIGTEPDVKSQIVKIQRSALITNSSSRIIAVVNFILWRPI